MDCWDGIIEVTPFGKGRPRVSKHGRPFTPKKTKSKEAEFKWWLIKLKAPKFDGPLLMQIGCYFKKPKSAPKTRRCPTVKPDIDNIVKLVLDAGNGILYDDDKQIVSLRVDKFYGEREMVCLHVEKFPRIEG